MVGDIDDSGRLFGPTALASPPPARKRSVRQVWRRNHPFGYKQNTAITRDNARTEGGVQRKVTATALPSLSTTE